RNLLEFALADLQHMHARAELERLVADDGAVDAHATTFDEAVALAGRSHQPRLLEQGADADLTAIQRNGLLFDLIGNAALAAIDEVLLGRVGRGLAVKARGDLLRELDLCFLRIAAAFDFLAEFFD